MTLNDLESTKVGLLANFSQYLVAAHILKVNTKFSTSNVDFSSLSPESRPPKFKEACARERQRVVPLFKLFILPILERLKVRSYCAR